VDAGVAASDGCEDEGALQPATASAARGISDKTILRMGKPHQRENKREGCRTPVRHDFSRGKLEAYRKKTAP
jgi:hypothetical protein